jgi:FAD/FMN-containing dehydrogenase
MSTQTINRPFSSDDAAVAADLPNLRARIVGDVVTILDRDYDTARKLHDFQYDRRPLAIIRAAVSSDVAEAVRFAGEHKRPLAVRSGGHSVAGYSAPDGALVIDLSGLRRVSIDPVKKTARAQAGATSADLAGPAHAYGLALSTGDTSTVGLGGLTTGGGIGYMVRKFGLAIDNLISAEVVVAGGEIVTVSAEANPALFWALRGGGGNFGIVTEFEFRMAEVGSVLGGAIVLPATREVIRGYLDYIETAPDDLTTITNFMHAPPAPFIPEDRVGEPVLVILATWTGEAEEGERVLAPLRALATPVADTVAQIPYPAMYQYMEAAAAPHGAAIRSMFTDYIDDEAIDALIAGMDRATSPFNIIQLRGFGGAMARVPIGDTAFAHRQRKYMVSILGLWFDTEDDGAAHYAWTYELWDQVKRIAQGVYVNFVADEGDGRIRDAYPPETYERLARTKKTYDPTNMFKFNQNVRPKA